MKNFLIFFLILFIFSSVLATAQKRAVEAIEKLGGKIEYDSANKL